MEPSTIQCPPGTAIKSVWRATRRLVLSNSSGFSTCRMSVGDRRGHLKSAVHDAAAVGAGAGERGVAPFVNLRCRRPDFEQSSSTVRRRPAVRREGNQPGRRDIVDRASGRTRPQMGGVNRIGGIPVDRLFLSATAIGEIRAGLEGTCKRPAAKARKPETRLDRVVSGYGVLPLDSATGRQWACVKHGETYFRPRTP